MNAFFQIPVIYKGELLTFQGKTLLNLGQLYKIQVGVKGHDIVFEPDEKRSFFMLTNTL